ncbi:MAG: UPF0280 family protein [Firmicutes bacterium]|nr:UPF0280 family protein [Bacillota bacterium]
MKRFYRQFMQPDDLTTFRISIGETVLWVAAQTDLSLLVAAKVRFYRRQLRAYIKSDPEFMVTLEPRPVRPGAPPLIRRMGEAAGIAGVGPMAAVAGAIAQVIGEDLRAESPEIILENGGDVYLRSVSHRTVAVYAGRSPLSGRIGVVLPPCPAGLGVCTSAGTVGHSLSFGRADAAMVIADDAAVADAVATALGNRLRTPSDLEEAVSWAVRRPTVRGALAVMGKHLAAAGAVELVPVEKRSVIG